MPISGDKGSSENGATGWMDYPFQVRQRSVMMPAWLHKNPETQFIMKRSFFHSTNPVTAIAICIAGICTVVSVNLQAKDLQVGRYSLLAATPTEAQAELLATTMTVRFPERRIHRTGCGRAVCVTTPCRPSKSGADDATRRTGNTRGIGIPPGARPRPPPRHV